jgi:type IV secretory pathway TrbL component
MRDLAITLIVCAVAVAVICMATAVVVVITMHVWDEVAAWRQRRQWRRTVTQEAPDAR